MGKSVLSAQGLPGKKKESTIKEGRFSDTLYAKSLPDEDTTKWILKDVPVDLDRLIAESKIKQ